MKADSARSLNWSVDGIHKRAIKRLVRYLLFVSLPCAGLIASAQDADPDPGIADPRSLLQGLDGYPHARRVDSDEQEVLDHEVGLGAIKKVRGVWQFRESERLSGNLVSYTWQIVDGFSSREVMQTLVDELQASGVGAPVFSCEGRACGKSAQWANRVFGQRILYGREDLQAYSVYRLGDADRDRMVIYSAARTSDRQYLHVELLVAGSPD